MWTPLEDMLMDRVRDGAGSDSPITPGHTAAVSSNPTSDTICDGLAVGGPFELVETGLMFLLMLVYSSKYETMTIQFRAIEQD